MKPAFAFLLVAVSMSGFSMSALSTSARLTAAQPDPQTEDEPAFDKVMNQLESQVARLDFAPVQLDFAAWLSLQQRAKLHHSQPHHSQQHQSQSQQSQPQQSRKNDTRTKSRLTRLASWRQMAANLQPETPCQHMRIDNLMLQLTLIHNRQKLLEQLPSMSRYSGSFANFPDGKAWYRHWLNAWLLLDGDKGVTDAHIAQLKKVAEQEIKSAYPEYLKSIEASKTQKLIAYSKSQQQAIVAALRTREQQVLTRLHHVFADLPGFVNVDIQRSSLPESFPAPGIYDPQNQVFYYHFTNNALQEQSLDWLYLHEAVPGHHMQMSLVNDPTFTNSMSLCDWDQASRFITDPMVSIEGWGAWAETLGQELGLYSQPASLAYALQWRVLRALRVLMDIGIHYEGWDDNKALTLWLTYFPQQTLPTTEAIAKREIARIHRWPVQVITYVYGKHLIDSAIAKLGADGSHIDKKYIHSTLLQLSNQPPQALKWLPELLKSKKIN